MISPRQRPSTASTSAYSSAQSMSQLTSTARRSGPRRTVPAVIADPSRGASERHAPFAVEFLLDGSESRAVREFRARHDSVG
jgi:hypothetical protein